ncbi:MAG: A/G-specific adenine glycosylase [Flavobacteriaceae bacterium CG2_30_34_30]|nr:MAG: A/G-specific adenine glycosylase [Flavobacteriaceae bacterium CG2_30_34_30]PIZ08141.1 MAG: A/G-specific adenine glycosylase [Flavobacteriaceae bacterium CG_4_10_14_0_8_um_filter_34_31]PJC07037.1 MAG: A/G-specific adenine glycosylase [Flavobacteriaceae bacterium CG_4_9_14_0_8_um_filter_34_30]
MDFSNKLTSWYLDNKRDLPWRKTKEPYFIWLSEIILQQTKIEQGMSFYYSFIQSYPTVFHLANASEQEVLKLWQGLGYYSRARNLHHSAKYIVENYNGIFPSTYKELLKLKGIGDYTASAISSICFNEPHAVVDGNVYRVLSRVFGLQTPINTSKGIKEFKLLAQEVMNTENPGTYNQAIMDFGALCCSPRNPSCETCIFQNNCYALLQKEIHNFPVKTSKTKIRNRFFNYLVIVSSDNKTLLQQRTEQGIWKNLYEFPLLETSDNCYLNHEVIQQEIPFTQVQSISLYNDIPIIHKLSHQHLHIRFWFVITTEIKDKGVGLSQITSFPVPVVLHNFIEKILLLNAS